MSLGVALNIYGMKVEVKLRNLGGQRVAVEGFYVDGKRCIPHSNWREETFKQLGRALETDYPGKFELVNLWPSLSPERK